jgi:predicted site-specific integrase-resolvase
MKLLRTREVAAFTGVPESTLRYWRCAGIGPCWVKLQGRVRYDEADVEAYVRANRRIPSVRAAM